MARKTIYTIELEKDRDKLGAKVEKLQDIIHENQLLIAEQQKMINELLKEKGLSCCSVTDR